MIEKSTITHRFFQRMIDQCRLMAAEIEVPMSEAEKTAYKEPKKLDQPYPLNFCGGWDTR